jgi:DNA polymerase-3 subunit alpha
LFLGKRDKNAFNIDAKLMHKSNQLSPSEYVHLHTHTHFSLLDGLTKIPALIGRTKELGMNAVAITDHGTLSGLIDFYSEAKSKSVKPILGMETYIAARSYKNKEPAKDKPNFHLTLLAMNNEGYKNLMQLSTIANLEGFYYRPRIDFQLLEQYQDGLIVLSGCIGGEVADNIRNGQLDQAEKIALKYKKLFGNRYYLELQDHGHPRHPSYWAEQKQVNDQLLMLGKKLSIPCVVTCDSHYLKREDKEAHEVLLCVQTGSYLNDPDRMSLSEFELHFTDPKEVIERWGSEHPDLIINTRKIADLCNVDIQLGNILIPKFPIPKGFENEGDYLKAMVYSGLNQRYLGLSRKAADKLTLAEASKNLPIDIKQRADYELKVINDMQFNGYFLIVWDFIRWGKDRGIVFGPGRGSAAGSIVSYALRITEIEPMRHNLMFERFLNPGRISMPDIDIDIQDTRRDEVIGYCIDKYGKDRVANIVTFGKMAARNAVRDVARVLQVPYAEADRLAKMIPPPVQGRHIPLATSLKQNPDLKREYSTNPSSKRVFDLAVQLEGTIRSHGIHAAGVVIAPEKIVLHTPLEMAQKGVLATQYSMGPIDNLGLLKIDFLGLSNLTILKNTLRIVKKVYNAEIRLDEIPIDDAKTFELIKNADTTGVFQFESAGMQRYLKQLKPTQFEDLVAMNALYRPGPLQEIPRFIEAKNNPDKIAYLHESLRPILEDTYGVITYQEQIIKLLQLVAGYSPGEADLVRKAIGKKKRDIMQAEEPRFIEGCIKQGLTKTQANRLWKQIQPFADYSFNKAHATCYAQIAYWTAYLKAHYPAAFMAALMTSDYKDTDRLAIEINECQKIGIPVLPPDINESFEEFGVIKSQGSTSIRFGLMAIKNVGSNAVEEIIKQRERGHFTSLEDFLVRVDYHMVNRKSLESLIKAGAFDRFYDRRTLLDNIELLIAFAQRAQKQANIGQMDLFGDSIDAHKTASLKLNLSASGAKHSSDKEVLAWERELLGLYLSTHPLTNYQEYLKATTTPIATLGEDMDGKSAEVGGIISTVREVVSRNGQKMAFVGIEDLSGATEAILFPAVYQLTPELWNVDKIVKIRGKISTKDRNGHPTNEVKLIVEQAREVTTEDLNINTKQNPNQPGINGPGAKGLGYAPTYNQRVYIRLSSSNNEGLLKNLKQTIDDFKGSTEVVLVLGNDSQKQIIKLPFGVKLNQDSVSRLSEVMGSENIVVR